MRDVGEIKETQPLEFLSISSFLNEYRTEFRGKNLTNMSLSQVE